MKIVIAPDKFKGSLSASALCDALSEGILEKHLNFEVVKFPLADGGEGSLQVLEEHLDLKTVSVEVHDPLFRKIEATYKRDGESAYIEMASASGFALLNKEERNPMHTTTLGTGELIAHAIDHGAKKIFLFIGGSATCDAGMGMATALGFRFLDKNKNELHPTGKNLSQIHHIDATARTETLAQINFITLCDVDNPLFGPNGAAYVFAPQKGASPEEVALLDKGLQHFSSMVKRHLKVDLRSIPGAGAAGGLGAGSIAFLSAKLQSGIQTILNITQFAKTLKDAAYLITGEGKLDEQTLQGKVVSGVAGLAKRFSIPLYVVCGISELSSNQSEDLGIAYLATIMQFAENERDAFKNTYAIAQKIAKEFPFNK